MGIETGWVPISMAIKPQVLKLRDRLKRMDRDRLTEKIFAWSESVSGRTRN